MNSKITNKLKEKYDAIDQDAEVHLEGLLHSKPINYWDYIHTDALLNLQVQRTVFPDENVFIMYHQVNELLFKMVLSEMDQIARNNNIDTDTFTTKLIEILLTNTPLNIYIGKQQGRIIKQVKKALHCRLLKHAIKKNLLDLPSFIKTTTCGANLKHCLKKINLIKI